MSFFMDKVINAYVDSLSADGKRIIKRAFETNDTEMFTGNMRDAYGYAVYYNKSMRAKGYANDNPTDEEHRGWRKMGIAGNTGRGYLDEFFLSYTPPNNGFVLICVNVIYYTSILENGAQGRPQVQMSRKYRIISQIDKDFDDLANKYKGSFVTDVNNG